MFVEITCVLSATVHCVVNPLPAAKAASQYTRFLSSPAIKGSRLQSGEVVTRRTLPLLRQLLKQPCPNREGNALRPTEQQHVSRSLGDSYDSVTELRTHMVSSYSDGGKESETTGGMEASARVLKTSDRCHCCHASYTRVQWKGNPAKQGDTCLAEEQVSV
jgi:hypothetical protein